MINASGRPFTGTGGEVDLAAGANRAIVTMLHTAMEGEPRIVKNTDYSLTVRQIITDPAVIDVTPGARRTAGHLPGT